MARARNIKPGLCKNEDLAECSIWARYLFACLPMWADRDGRLEDRPKRLKAEILPFDSQDVEPLLRELASHGTPRFIIRYENEHGKFIQITRFKEHQTPHYSEKPSVIKPQDSGSEPSIKPGRLQDITGDDAQQTPGTLQDTSESPPLIKRGSQPPDSLIPDSLNLIPDSGSLIPDSPNPDSREKAIAHASRSPAQKLADLGVDEQVAKDWLAVRKAKRAPLTDTALKDLVAEAGKAGIPVSQAVAICAKRSWQGFKASWDWQGNGGFGASQPMGKQAALEARNRQVADGWMPPEERAK